MNDLFVAEEPILERLRLRLPLARRVSGARDIKEIPAGSGATPALYLIFDGHAPLAHAGPEQAFEQFWLVVVAVRNVRDAQGGAGERREAGPLLNAVCRALLGWSPGEGFSPLRMVSTPGAHFTDEVALFPMRFATRLLTSGE
ncbi:MAG: hypothetical protein HQL97_11580 [Magnetococcales bacterium]|nr:hypothetical protein [Magnetococcales bacterium]